MNDRLKELVSDARLCAAVMSNSGTFPTGQSVINSCADALTEQAAEIERLTAFIEELRDYKPEIHSGRMADPQDDVPDVIEAETFLLFQEDATDLLNKEPTT